MTDQRIARVGALSRLALAATPLLILAACGSGAASPEATVTPASTPETTPEVTSSPEPTASPAETPVPTRPTAAAECTPDATTPMSADWVEQASLSGDYRFKRPADWADLSAEVKLPTSSSVSPGTFTETGLPSDAEHQVDAVRAFDGTLVTAWVIDGVTTRTDALFERELAWLKTQPQMKAVISEELEACIGGSRARGFNSTWTSGSADTYIVIFIVQRNGKMYEVQLTAPAAVAEVTYHELLSSWEFTQPLDGLSDLDDQFAATDYKVIGMAATLDDSGDNPNTGDFQDVFPARSDKIYVIYELDDGTAGTVNFSWAREGRELFPSTFDYTDTTTFAWGWIEPPSSGLFTTGNYTVTLTLQNSGDTITVPFRVE